MKVKRKKEWSARRHVELFESKDCCLYFFFWEKNKRRKKEMEWRRKKVQCLG